MQRLELMIQMIQDEWVRTWYANFTSILISWFTYESGFCVLFQVQQFVEVSFRFAKVPLLVFRRTKHFKNIIDRPIFFSWNFHFLGRRLKCDKFWKCIAIRTNHCIYMVHTPKSLTHSCNDVVVDFSSFLLVSIVYSSSHHLIRLQENMENRNLPTAQQGDRWFLPQNNVTIG